MSNEREIIIQDHRYETEPDPQCNYPMNVMLENVTNEDPALVIFYTGEPYGVTLIHGSEEKHAIPDGRDYSWEEPISYDLEEMSLEDMRNIGRLFIAAADHIEKMNKQ